MEPVSGTQFWPPSSTSTWTFVFFFASVCSGMDTPKIELQSRVFVAFTGEGLNLNCTLNLPANQTDDLLTCSDPSSKQIYDCKIPATLGQPQDLTQTLELKHLNTSGEYSCRYKTATVYWFLQVRKEGYKEPIMLDYTEVSIVTVFTGVLLVFSVVGSVYVFRGHWNKDKTEGSTDTGRKQKQNREERKKRETEEHNVAVTDSSFYASLEARPGSIYDVLDHSAANTETDERKPKPKKKEQQKTMTQTTKSQNEDIFESVYENF
ncbi:uncharacterized protein si:ch211-243a20.4 [Dicentrarchus labrax]|uniref:uncharacterized protein si:ch211-243a20.4 n=1 Tax=Dicentrarchus labrax TaxID=13489 RepID=UPI0021F6911C|nr:uncharacterized protein si:ch211-243a20.4 [Dicentrarchus labrax]